MHGGWQGLAAGIIEHSFDRFRLAGVSVEDLQIAIVLLYGHVAMKLEGPLTTR
ncbi:hypothetical protein G7009_08140 [Pseudomonas capeferrum]|nr:hypothetical protein [Pseudomonas capeferrum]